MGEGIVLSGPPGVGKSTIGRAVADRLGIPAVDLDEVIAEQQKETPADIIRARGEAAFRELELQALRSLDDRPALIALGGGTLTHPPARTAARARGALIGLYAEPGVIEARLPGGDRPLLDGGLAGLMAARAQSYRAVDRRIDATGPIDDVAAEVGRAAAELTHLVATMGDVRSRILVGPNLEEACAGAVAALDPQRRVLLVLDAGVPEPRRTAYRTAIENVADVEAITIPGGEAVKQWDALGRLLEHAIAAGCGRQSVVVGLGGGATCDVAAMAASLLGRGAPVVLVPSTLLAQVDASVGGKTAVNLGGRNLVGSFHPASDVLIDVTLTESQDHRDYRAGLAELLKMGVICDPALFDAVVESGRATTATITRGVAHKARIVEADPREAGLRKTLNLGHTLAHGLEAADQFRLRHGEAVAIGTAAIARFSVEQGWLEPSEMRRIIEGLQRLGLPTDVSEAQLHEAVKHVETDKKGTKNAIDLVCIHAVGNVRLHRLTWTDVQTGFVRNGGTR